MKKYLIPIIVLFLVIVVLGLLLVFLSRSVQPGPTGTEPGATATARSGDKKQPPLPTPPVPIQEFDPNLMNPDAPGTAEPGTVEADQAALQLFARNFIEDFGGYSTNSGYEHIERLFPQMTTAMQEFASNWIKSNPARLRSDTFYSIETAVARVEIASYSDTAAVLKLETTRKESDVPEYYNRSFNQNAEVKFVKVKKEWQVEAVEWR